MKRRITTVRGSIFSLSLSLVALGLVFLGQTPAVRADDRDLLKESVCTEPYLFILFDNTGSMQRRVDNGNTAALLDDDPASRLYQAKGALDQVLLSTTGVNFGFATFPNQTGHRITNKSSSNRRVNNSETQGLWCQGIETNDDRNMDEDFNNDPFSWATTTTPTSNLSIGDLVPLDWEDNNVQRIRERMAPNLALGECPDPEAPGYATCAGYGIERYFEDPVCTSYRWGRCWRWGPANGTHLRLLDQEARPFVASGNTPLGGALNDFRAWYAAWRPLAEQNDPELEAGTRQVHVVLMTDGFETCGGDGVTAAANLLDIGIKTFVIGFSVNNPALDAIAVAGDTEAAFTAQNQLQLVESLGSIVEEILGEARTFSTAAVPSVVGSASKNLFLSSFSPTQELEPVWPGRLHAYEKPLTAVSTPIWKAEEELLKQAERLVYFGIPGTVPENRLLFQPPVTEEEQDVLYGPEGFGFPIPAPSTDRTDFLADGQKVVDYFLRVKTAEIADPDNPTGAPIIEEYLMGDVFHSDPATFAAPTRTDYFSTDVQLSALTCGEMPEPYDLQEHYGCFVRRHIGRRRVLLTGSNEGALHAFDAGYAKRDADDQIEYTDGTGKELFAYVPRSVMAEIRDMSEGGEQRFTVDGPVTVDDVLLASSLDEDYDKMWSTVAIGGLREGGSSYYALDITQPDPVAEPTPPLPDAPERRQLLPLPDVASDGGAPKCSAGSTVTDCGSPYPSMLWEFEDLWDEDDNGRADLGFSWSKVNTGRIRIDGGLDADSKPVMKDMYVAVFGGGLDPEFKKSPVLVDGKYRYSGNYLYMVDIETGKTVYKRRIDKTNYYGALRVPSMAPSEPAAVDTDQDSYLDTIYIGTTGGYLYKADISEPVVLEEDVKVENWLKDNPTTGEPPFLETTDRITDSRWDPFPIFFTGPAGEPTKGRPIYYPPSVIFVPELARFALAFGTGDREDLWAPRDEPDPLDGRFYVLLDDGLEPDDTDKTALPLDESDLEGFVASDFEEIVPEDLLAVGGYHLELANRERLIAKTFGLSGIVFYSTYTPKAESVGALGCGSSGISRLYAIFTNNGSGINDGKRYREVEDFVTSPFVESDTGAGDKPPPGEEQDPPEGSEACSAEELQAIRTSLMSKMPPECNFAQYSLNVMTLSSRSGVECIVPIPVCVVQRNWKEF